jgi:hypothetical protein
MSKDNFEQYVISEFKVDNQAAVEIKYTHNVSIKKAVINHMITMNLKFYDKNVKLLKTCTLKFLNNVIAPSYAKKLININPGELNNKFMSAKEDIIKVIHAEYEEKMNEIVEKMNQLKQYGVKQFGIEDKFRGELVKPVENQNEVKNKKSYDM